MIQNFSDLQIGDKFKFGNYHGPIEWRILDKTQDTLFVISEYALDSKPFDEEGKTSDWNTCSLKRWLNSAFFNNAFDPEEKSLIENTSFGKIFLLSIEEAMIYFSGDSDRQCKPTQYAKSQGEAMYQQSCWWWLRSRYDFDIYAVIVNADGDVGYSNVIYASGFVHPAMRLKI